MKGQVTIPKPLRESPGLAPGQEFEFEERDGTVAPLRALVGLVSEGVDIDAYLEETRGLRWQADLDGGEG